MSHPIVLPADINISARWAECLARDSVSCWRAMSDLLMHSAMIEYVRQVADDLLTLCDLAQRHAADLAPFADREAA